MKLIPVYEFSELSPTAKSRARDWYRKASLHDAVYDDFERVCEILGVELKPGRIFFSQGDGACFEARVSYAKGMVAKIKEYAPQDLKLHAIAEAMAAVPPDVTYRGRYFHEDLLVEPMRDLAHWLYRSLEAEHDYQNSDEVIEANGYTFTETGRRFG